MTPPRPTSPREEGSEIRSMHPYGYRVGEWGRIQAVIYDPSGQPGSYVVVWPDDDTDFWPVDDPSDEREFRA